ncbi:MAG: homoserine dehydrogenase [bacterium]|nr:homoserine dehydrogenase [bacterium]
MKNVAVMGYGTVGSGVVEILLKNRGQIAEKNGEDIAVKYVLDLREFPDSPVADKIIHDFEVLVNDETVDIVVETMGGLNPSYPFVKRCLEAGKHVVTSNKALVAAYGTELLQIARERQVNFLFEASVGGGIPIIRPLYQSLAGEKIEEITGILNGTTNYILTKMGENGESFDAALKKAQELGYAERNPEADVEGYDTCRKIAILTAVSTGCEVNYEEIYTEGITGITDVDFRYAKKMGTSIKLFGSSRMQQGKAFAWVAPVMIPPSHPLYAVSDVFNGILVKGEALGVSMFYGSGAGKLPTASAVVADIVDAAKNSHKNVYGGWSSRKLELSSMEEAEHRYFARIAGCEKDSIDSVKKELGQTEVIKLEEESGEYAILTDKMPEKEWNQKKDKLAADGVEILQVIRAEV